MIYEVIGWIGTGLVVVDYFLVSTGRLSSQSRGYQFINLAGAVSLIINSLYHQAVPSVGLNVVWLLIALYSLVRIVKK